MRWRVDPERRGALAVMGAILVAALAVGWQALASRPHSQPVADSVPVSTSASTPVEGSGSAGARSSLATGGSLGSSENRAPAGTAGTGGAVTAVKVVVDVVGRVHRPGLVTLPAGARVADAIRAAGGALVGTDLSTINLARMCVDGEQVAVGVLGATPGAGAGTAPGTGAGGTAAGGTGAGSPPVDLNTATADQLDALPGVGPVMAQRIIQYRTDHGPFTSVDQLQQVSGIGAAKFAELSPLVTV